MFCFFASTQDLTPKSERIMLELLFISDEYNAVTPIKPNPAQRLVGSCH